MPWEHPKLANLTLSLYHYNYQPPVPCWHDQISITRPDLSNCSASASKSAPRRNHSSRPRSLLPNGLKVYSQRWTSDRSLSLKLVPSWWSIILDHTNIKSLGDDDNASLNQFFFSCSMAACCLNLGSGLPMNHLGQQIKHFLFVKTCKTWMLPFLIYCTYTKGNNLSANTFLPKILLAKNSRNSNTKLTMSQGPRGVPYPYPTIWEGKIVPVETGCLILVLPVNWPPWVLYQDDDCFTHLKQLHDRLGDILKEDCCLAKGCRWLNKCWIFLPSCSNMISWSWMLTAELPGPIWVLIAYRFPQQRKITSLPLWLLASGILALWEFHR